MIHMAFINKLFGSLRLPQLFRQLGTVAVFLLVPATGALAATPTNDPDSQFIWGLCKIVLLIHGSFGAVVVSVAGVSALVFAAIGHYRTAANVVALAAGSWVIVPLINLFFGSPVCTEGSVQFLPAPVGLGGFN